MTKRTTVPGNDNIVRPGIVELLKAARNVSWSIRTTYREIGRTINRFEELAEEPAEELTRQSGRGFARRNLWQVRAFDRAGPEQKIDQTVPCESLTFIVSSNIGSNRSSSSGATARPHWRCFPFLGLLSKRTQEARSSYATETLGSG